MASIRAKESLRRCSSNGNEGFRWLAGKVVACREWKAWCARTNCVPGHGFVPVESECRRAVSPAAGRHQRQPWLAGRGDRGVVNLHRSLSIIASSLSPATRSILRFPLLPFLLQSPSSINSNNGWSLRFQSTTSDLLWQIFISKYLSSLFPYRSRREKRNILHLLDITGIYIGV